MLNCVQSYNKKNEICKFLEMEMSKKCGLLVYIVVIAILDRYAIPEEGKGIMRGYMKQFVVPKR